MMEKEEKKLKKIYSHTADKRKTIMKCTEISHHELFGNILGKSVFSAEQITKPKIFFGQ